VKTARAQIDEALDVFKSKAPVCLCDVRPCVLDMCGPQKKSFLARVTLMEWGVSFPDGYQTALSHAFMGYGRTEFDDLMRDWTLT